MAVPTAPTLRRGPVFFSSADLVLQRNQERRQRGEPIHPWPDDDDDDNDNGSSCMPPPPSMLPLSDSSSVARSLSSKSSSLNSPLWALNMTPASGGLIDDDDEADDNEEEEDPYRSTTTFNPLHARHMQYSKSQPYSPQEQALYEAAVPLCRAGFATAVTFTPTHAADEKVMPLPTWRPSSASASAVAQTPNHFGNSNMYPNFY